MRNDINNKIALISGGLGDIGSAIALLFGKSGFRVTIGDLKEETDAVEELEELKQNGCNELLYQRVDVSSEASVINWLDTIEGQWGTPQIVVANAGIVVLGSLVEEDLPVIKAKKQLDVNFWGSYHVAVQTSKRMKAQKLPGRIVFMGSWAAERPDVRIPAYCISKAAIRMLCKTLALELAQDNILVNEIAPGIVSGGLSKQNQGKDSGLLHRQLNAIPVNKLISVEEVAKKVLNLCDFEDKSTTGIVLRIDGGLSLTSKMSS